MGACYISQSMHLFHSKLSNTLQAVAALGSTEARLESVEALQAGAMNELSLYGALQHWIGAGQQLCSQMVFTSSHSHVGEEATAEESRAFHQWLGSLQSCFPPEAGVLPPALYDSEWLQNSVGGASAIVRRALNSSTMIQAVPVASDPEFDPHDANTFDLSRSAAFMRAHTFSAGGAGTAATPGLHMQGHYSLYAIPIIPAGEQAVGGVVDHSRSVSDDAATRASALGFGGFSGSVRDTRRKENSAVGAVAVMSRLPLDAAQHRLLAHAAQFLAGCVGLMHIIRHHRKNSIEATADVDSTIQKLEEALSHQTTVSKELGVKLARATDSLNLYLVGGAPPLAYHSSQVDINDHDGDGHDTASNKGSFPPRGLASPGVHPVVSGSAPRVTAGVRAGPLTPVAAFRRAASATSGIDTRTSSASSSGTDTIGDAVHAQDLRASAPSQLQSPVEWRVEHGEPAFHWALRVQRSLGNAVRVLTQDLSKQASEWPADGMRAFGAELQGQLNQHTSVPMEVFVEDVKTATTSPVVAAATVWSSGRMGVMGLRLGVRSSTVLPHGQRAALAAALDCLHPLFECLQALHTEWEHGEELHRQALTTTESLEHTKAELREVRSSLDVAQEQLRLYRDKDQQGSDTMSLIQTEAEQVRTRLADLEQSLADATHQVQDHAAQQSRVFSALQLMAGLHADVVATPDQVWIPQDVLARLHSSTECSSVAIISLTGDKVSIMATHDFVDGWYSYADTYAANTMPCSESYMRAVLMEACENDTGASSAGVSTLLKPPIAVVNHGTSNLEEITPSMAVFRLDQYVAAGMASHLPTMETRRMQAVERSLRGGSTAQTEHSVTVASSTFIVGFGCAASPLSTLDVAVMAAFVALYTSVCRCALAQAETARLKAQTATIVDAHEQQQQYVAACIESMQTANGVGDQTASQRAREADDGVPRMEASTGRDGIFLPSLGAWLAQGADQMDRLYNAITVHQAGDRSREQEKRELADQLAAAHERATAAQDEFIKVQQQLHDTQVAAEAEHDRAVQAELHFRVTEMDAIAARLRKAEFEACNPPASVPVSSGISGTSNATVSPHARTSSQAGVITTGASVAANIQVEELLSQLAISEQERSVQTAGLRKLERRVHKLHASLTDADEVLTSSQQAFAMLQQEIGELRRAIADKECIVESLRAELVAAQAAVRSAAALNEIQEAALHDLREQYSNMKAEYLTLLHSSGGSIGRDGHTLGVTTGGLRA